MARIKWPFDRRRNHAKLWLTRRVSPHLQVNSPNRTHPWRWRLVRVLVEVSSRRNQWTANDRSKQKKHILLVNCSGHWSCAGVSSSSSSLLLFGSDISSLSDPFTSPSHKRKRDIVDRLAAIFQFQVNFTCLYSQRINPSWIRHKQNRTNISLSR